MKFLAICSIFLLLFLPGGKVQSVENVADSFNYANKIQVIIDNEKTELNLGDEKFNLVLNVLNKITEYAHDMPAFGVSLDELTKEEMKSGLWLELEFETTMIYNEMPFEALLIKVEKDISGFNLIRRNNGNYEGRCFYLSLDGSMNELYELINQK